MKVSNHSKQFSEVKQKNHNETNQEVRFSLRLESVRKKKTKNRVFFRRLKCRIDTENVDRPRLAVPRRSDCCYENVTPPTADGRIILEFVSHGARRRVCSARGLGPQNVRRHDKTMVYRRRVTLRTYDACIHPESADRIGRSSLVRTVARSTGFALSRVAAAKRSASVSSHRRGQSSDKLSGSR